MRLIISCLLAGVFVVTATTQSPPVVRVAVVNTPDVLLTALLPSFQERFGYRVNLAIGEAAFEVARAGNADLVIAHYGHQGTEAFVSEGLGRWPKMVFSNQAALLGPLRDPVGIRGWTDVVEGFRWMVRRGGEFVVNNAPTERYLAELIWDAAGRPPKTGWWLDTGLRDQAAIDFAAQRGAYTLWGLIPFLRLKAETDVRLDAMVTEDALLQRVMVSIVVNPARTPGVNDAGALALQRFLLEPGTQARIRDFRHDGLRQQTWWPAGRFNAGTDLVVR
jgi:tungstate transport system substrate-binding protein